MAEQSAAERAYEERYGPDPEWNVDNSAALHHRRLGHHAGYADAEAVNRRSIELLGEAIARGNTLLLLTAIRLDELFPDDPEPDMQRTLRKLVGDNEAIRATLAEQDNVGDITMEGSGEPILEPE